MEQFISAAGALAQAAQALKEKEIQETRQRITELECEISNLNNELSIINREIAQLEQMELRFEMLIQSLKISNEERLLAIRRMLSEFSLSDLLRRPNTLVHTFNNDMQTILGSGFSGVNSGLRISLGKVQGKLKEKKSKRLALNTLCVSKKTELAYQCNKLAVL